MGESKPKGRLTRVTRDEDLYEMQNTATQNRKILSSTPEICRWFEVMVPQMLQRRFSRGHELSLSAGPEVQGICPPANDKISQKQCGEGEGEGCRKAKISQRFCGRVFAREELRRLRRIASRHLGLRSYAWSQKILHRCWHIQWYLTQKFNQGDSEVRHPLFQLSQETSRA
jgi:hypothetical protein